MNGVAFLQLANGMGKTVGIFILTLLFSLPLGLPVYLGRVSRFPLLSFLMRVYISIMRGTPLMLQLLVIYFGPYYLFNLQISMAYRFYAVIIAFSINYAAYFAEIYRGGFQSIPHGQKEAAQVLGYSRTQTFLLILLPQMFRRVLPSITNEVITLVKIPLSPLRLPIRKCSPLPNSWLLHRRPWCHILRQGSFITSSILWLPWLWNASNALYPITGFEDAYDRYAY